MLFHPKNKRVFKVIFTVLSVMVILGMVLVYVPIGQ